MNPKLGPPVPKEERVHDVGVILKEVVVGVVPLAGLIAATLGSILAGAATPTEAAGIGGLGALLLAMAYRKLSWAGLKQACLSTMATSSMVLFLAVTSNIFGAVFARMGSANWITETMLALPLPPTAMLILVVFLIFLLGWPFEWPAIILVFLPIFYPVVKALDFDLVWFGALTAVVLQTAFLSPPVAMSAYYLRQVVRDWSLSTIYKGMFEFMMIQVLAIVLLIAFPKIATWLPEQLAEARRSEVVEKVEDTAESLERDTMETMQEQSQESLEKADATPPSAPGSEQKKE
jgi:TRAP-type mannitol/chloroaromatic compound transport system permease large subunit